MIQRDDVLLDEILNLFKIEHGFSDQYLYTKLMEDTNDTGKLFKYKSFIKEQYTLAALRNNELYCATAEEFNDPFDSLIEFSAREFLETALLISFQELEDILTAFFNIFYCNKTVKDAPLKYQDTVTIMLCRVLERNWIGKIQSLRVKNNQLESALFCIDICMEVFDALCTVKKHHVFFTEKNRAKLYNSFLGNTTTFVNWFLPAKRIDFEQLPESILREFDKLDEQMLKTIHEKIRIGCLTNSHDNEVMWASYADSHKGICIEYDWSERIKDVYNTSILPVIYSDNTVQLPYDAICEDTEANRQELMQAFVSATITKRISWQYEHEWRIIQGSKQGKYYMMPQISCVYLGCKIDSKHREAVLQIAREKHFAVKQMRVFHPRFGFTYEELYDGKSL